MTGLESLLHFFIIPSCIFGTSLWPTSKAKSPLATIIASEALIISSIFFTANLFSIFEIIPIFFPNNFFAL